MDYNLNQWSKGPDMNPLYKADVLKALEQVRPYIKADGGDVELVDIADNGIVSVRLTGNCIGCASAGVTMFDGIQAALQGQLAWVTGVEKVEDDGTGASADTEVTAPVFEWQQQAFGHVRDVLDALENLQPGEPLPDAVPAFIDASRGMIASLLRLEEDVLYGAAESVLGMTAGPGHVLRQEHELLHRLFADFTQTMIRYGALDGPAPRELYEKAQRLARAFEQHLQKERSALFGPLNHLPDDLKRELREDIARHAAHRGMALTAKAQP
jgi:Fe-S cluster biogenesis protein NfuA